MHNRALSVTALLGARVRALHLVGPAAVVKALDAFVQLAFATLIVLIPGSVLSGAPNTLVTRDMVGDPGGRFAAHIATASERVRPDGHMWLVIGLFAVAAVKLVLALLVLLRARFANLAAVLVFGFLTVFEALWSAHGSPLLMAIVAVDAAIVVVLATQLSTRARLTIP
ncbi:DUF2127 domain-containing protein [Sciscionella sediminilitoris]|uniref:DUF2127 domain-containing protein n=1 Tax=Sciscionella sediminilitoris TaxID=1445613 RepID=UPI0004DF6E3A|nr:DUF2127 domain-containing protein [Sciscionella sp. SE31]